MISVRNLSKSFDTHLVLESITIDIPNDKWVGIRGASGSGKSTLLRILLGLQNADSGTIRWDDKSLIENGNAQSAGMRLWRQHVIWTPQSVPFASYTPRNVIEELQHIGSLAKNETDALTDTDWLSLLNLNPTLLDQSFQNLSGGQYQRILLGLGYLRDQDWWLMDEPTSALDFDARMRVVELLKRKQNTTYIIATHDNLILDHCDLVFTIENKGISRS